MEEDRIRWNEKYRRRRYSRTPTDIVVRHFSLAGRGRALDLAAGTGKNALFLAEKGFEVDAVDISDVAMDDLAGRHPRVHAHCVDLDGYRIPRRRYRLVVNIRYLNRALFPGIVEALVPGGLLIFETFIGGPQAGDPGMRRDYLLRENELLHAFLSLRILRYAEKSVAPSEGPDQVASLVARKRER